MTKTTHCIWMLTKKKNQYSFCSLILLLFLRLSISLVHYCQLLPCFKHDHSMMSQKTTLKKYTSIMEDGRSTSVCSLHGQLSQGQMANFPSFIASKSFDLWNHHISQMKWHNLWHITCTVNFWFKHVRFKEVFRFKEEFHCYQNFIK